MRTPAEGTDPSLHPSIYTLLLYKDALTCGPGALRAKSAEQHTTSSLAVISVASLNRLWQFLHIIHTNGSICPAQLGTI